MGGKLVRKFVAGLSHAGPGGITCLGHKAFNHPVKDNAIIKSLPRQGLDFLDIDKGATLQQELKLMLALDDMALRQQQQTLLIAHVPWQGKPDLNFRARHRNR